MLIAYLDEIGEPGAFVSKEHSRFNTNPVFGYAGFVLPDAAVRDFGRAFTGEKRRVFSGEIAEVEAVGQWERKGSDIFTPDAWSDYPAQIRVFRGLISKLSANVQFADWVAAAINRAIDRQLVPDSRYMWIPEALRRHMTGTMTNESKLHLWQSSLSDFNHIGIFKEARPVVERLAAASMSSEDLRKLEKVKHAAQKARLQ